RPSYVTWLDAVALSLRDVDLDLDTGLVLGQLDSLVDETVDARQGMLHLLRLLCESPEVLAVQADNEVVLRPGQHLTDTVVREAFDPFGEARVVRDHSLDGGERCAVVRLPTDCDPDLARVDVHDFIGGNSAADMSANGLDTFDGVQLAAGP